jgi:hypothetical protein
MQGPPQLSGLHIGCPLSIMGVHIGGPYWGSKMGVPIGAGVHIGGPYWGSKLGVQIGGPNWGSKSKIRVRNPGPNFKRNELRLIRRQAHPGSGHLS